MHLAPLQSLHDCGIQFCPLHARRIVQVVRVCEFGLRGNMREWSICVYATFDKRPELAAYLSKLNGWIFDLGKGVVDCAVWRSDDTNELMKRELLPCRVKIRLDQQDVGTAEK